ncbi:hypothetical protein TTRE_0000954501 [Trichuris trichiura]|uniref:Uncharacterized protein n=1 Tax=Trichuris trichiura TaxID=36087 RepID=A0A077ZLC1_TRITR|nr:hypothetical protein TTRE_0000954501 [Trichuris trichiura]
MMSTRMSKVQQGPSRSIDTSEEVASLLRFIDAIQKHGVIDDVSIALMVLDIFACFSSSSSSKTIVVKTLDSDTASGLLSSLSMIFRTMDEKLFEEMGVANLPVVAHVMSGSFRIAASKRGTSPVEFGRLPLFAVRNASIDDSL